MDSWAVHAWTADAAAGGGYVDEAADALQTANVYVSPEVDGASGLQASLEAQVADASIGVAVFSDNAQLEASGPEIVAQLADKAPYETIIVAVGDDLSAGSYVLDTGEAMRIANEAEHSADGLGPALAETVQGVQDAQAGTPDGGGAADDAGPGVGVAIGVAVIAAVVVAGAAAVVVVVRSRRRRADAGQGRLPEPIGRHVAALRSLSVAYAQVGAAGNAEAAETATEITAIAVNVEELFGRLARAGSGQRGTAAIEYDATLRKLTAALDRDYLLDLLTHPQLWDDPDERVREVRGAIEAVSAELVQNIKQLNARRGLQFQVSLDGLIGRRKELQEWEREFERAAGEGGPDASLQERPGS
ncbi:hypothetical protein ACDF64_05005 [Agromyces sp. MMS24-JH15]|uniref:hypothetical protein n=1 Tax=Agromyces sp. MMS24-JH15 TaxID=3243765 RepID=UPI003749352D